MEFDKVLEKRVSARDFTDQKLTDEEVAEILDAANKAPIAMGEYDKCQLIVIRDKALLEEISEEYRKKAGVKHDALYGAPVMILFTSSKETSAAFEDCGCVLENIALKATVMGLGSCYIRGAIQSLGNDATYLDSLDLANKFHPVSGIILGHSKKENPPKDHKIRANFIG